MQYTKLTWPKGWADGFGGFCVNERFNSNKYQLTKGERVWGDPYNSMEVTVDAGSSMILEETSNFLICNLLRKACALPIPSNSKQNCWMKNIRQINKLRNLEVF